MPKLDRKYTLRSRICAVTSWIKVMVAVFLFAEKYSKQRIRRFTSTQCIIKLIYFQILI